MTNLPECELTAPRLYNHRSTKPQMVGTIYMSIEEWRACLCQQTFDTTKVTLKNTTWMVKTLQVQSREYLKDCYKTRVYALRPHRIHNVMYSDTIFLSFTSIRCYKCFVLFAFEATKVTKYEPMYMES